MKSKGYIDENGKYIRGKDRAIPHDVNPLHKDWSHSIERKEFSREIIQPRSNGKPNRDFIESYPEYSKKYFSQEEIDKAMRGQL